MALKIFVTDNYFYIVEPDNRIREGHARDVLVRKKNTDSTTYFIDKVNGWKSKDEIDLSEIQKENGDPYTESEWVDFYTLNTGYNSNPAIQQTFESLEVGTEAGKVIISEKGIELQGDASMWDDIVGSLVSRRLANTTGRLDYDYEENAIKMQTSGNPSSTSDRLMFSYQYPHASKTDGTMNLHIHWEQTDALDHTFFLQYRVQKNDQAKTIPWTDVTVSSNANNLFTYVSGTLNQITELEQIDMTGAGLSPTVQFRLTRTDSNGGDILATFADAHVERDSIGSDLEYIK